MKTLAAELKQLLMTRLTPQFSTLEVPIVLAESFELNRHSKYSLECLDLKSTSEAFAGLAIEQLLPLYLKAHEKLAALGYTRESQKLEFGNDAYVYVLPDREIAETESISELLAGVLDEHSAEEDVALPRVKLVKAIVMELQSKNYIFVFEKNYGSWRMHVRRFWEHPKVLEGDHPIHLGSYVDRKDLTVLDVIRLASLASLASEYYSDDIEGTPSVTRPSLETFTRGSMNPRATDAGAGLRYGDGRDAGYVLSFDGGIDGDMPKVADVLWNGYTEMSHVISRMAAVIDELDIEEA